MNGEDQTPALGRRPLVRSNARATPMNQDPTRDPAAGMLDRLEALCRDETTAGQEDRGPGELQAQLSELLFRGLAGGTS